MLKKKDKQFKKGVIFYTIFLCHTLDCKGKKKVHFFRPFKNRSFFELILDIVKITKLVWYNIKFNSYPSISFFVIKMP